MPKTGPRSSRSEESTVRRRLEWELRHRNLSYGALAARLTASGHPTHPSAINKLLHGRPRRRITVNELAALADVLEISLTDLLTSQDVVLSEQANKLLQELESGSEDLGGALSRYEGVLSRIGAYVEDGDLMDEGAQETLANLRNAVVQVAALYEAAVDRIYGLDDFEAGHSNPSALRPRKAAVPRSRRHSRPESTD